MKRIVSAVFALVLAAAGSVEAQNPTQAGPSGPPPNGIGEVFGTVVDTADQTPVSRASITVRTKADSALVTGAYTSPDGAFRIQGLRPGAYYLRAVLIGFKPRNYTFEITPAAPRLNVGPVPLTRVAVALQAVQVEGTAPTMVIEPDRNSYRAKDIAPAAANASDVLAATPSVEVDADGKVSLRGNENVAVQINGRPAPIRGPQLAAYLKGLPANIVERIEVIPNPSAKYDPEGMAGILNIVLKQDTDLGLSAGLNTGIAETDRYNASGNVGYQSGPVSLMSNLGIYSDDREIEGINDRERFDAVRSLMGVTSQDIAGRTGGKGQNLSTTVDYRFSPKTTLSNVLSVNRRHGGDTQTSRYTELDEERSPIDYYSRPRNTDTRGFMFDYTMALKRVMEPRKHELSTEVRFNRSHDEDGSVFWKQPLNSSGGPTSFPVEGENNFTDALTRQLTAQADYTKSFGASYKLETGYKGNARWLDRDFLVETDSLGDGVWTRSDRSNAFEFDETVHAAYGVLSRSAGKVQLQAGLRAEHASRNFALVDAAEEFPYDYASLFPSGVIMYNP